MTKAKLAKQIETTSVEPVPPSEGIKEGEMKIAAKELKRLVEEQREAEAKEPWRTAKILWYSVAPWIKSGYGNVTNHMVEGLIHRGMNIFISSYYGLSPGGFLRLGPVLVLPTEAYQDDKFGFRTTVEHYRKFNCNMLIYHTDFWIAKSLTDAIKETYCYTPIDHEDYQEDHQDVLKSFASVAVPSRHGQKELKKYGIDAAYVPHGVDISNFKPMDKTTCKKELGIDPSNYVIGMAAANNDKEPRKAWDKDFQGIKIFLENNPSIKNVKVFVHSRGNDPRGYNLVQLAKRLGISQHFVFQDPYMALLGLPPNMMAKVFNSFDVMLAAARREGFGIPMLEAQACRVPVITTKFSAMTERVNYGKAGWLVKPVTTMHSPLNAVTAIPDENEIAKCLEEAYYDKEKSAKFAKAGYRYALTQTWDIAIDRYMKPWIIENLQKMPKFGKPIENKPKNVEEI